MTDVIQMRLVESKLVSAAELRALNRIARLAQDHTHQAERAANFLLAWWNAGVVGGAWAGFDFTNLWAIDLEVLEDMKAVISMFSRNSGWYLDSYMSRLDIERVCDRWPNLGRSVA